MKCLYILLCLILHSSLSISSNHQECVDGICSCVKGWAEPDCLQPDKRSPFPCTWREKHKYFKYPGRPKEYLKQLSCRARRLQTLNDLEAFRGDTELLDLGHNYFLNNQSATDLKNNVLRYMPDLRKISLERCSMVSLDDDFFAYNENLEAIDLKWNSISALSADTFKHNPNLVKITLTGNPLPAIPEDLFANNPDLREVRLDFTLLKVLPTNLFIHNPHLRYLNLNYNMELEWMSGRTVNKPSLEFVGLLNTWYLHPDMRKEFCEEDWCLRAGNRYPTINQLVKLLDRYFDEDTN